MRLLTKFSLVFILVFGLGMAAAATLSYRFLQENAREQVVQDARLMMEMMHSARDYTTNQIKPLLQAQQEHDNVFLPQTVPAYAATESFNYLRARYPEYEYKEATLNPTNPRDRAVDWEADIINVFRRNPNQHELISERDTPTGRSLFLARPMAADPPCLSCHDTADRAPAPLVRRYGRDNGFGWQAGDIVSAQIVSVPMSVPVRMANTAYRGLLVYLGVIFAFSLALLEVMLLFIIVRPVARLSTAADQISMGNFEAPELPAGGKDEISVLAGSFNRMRRSLEKALKLLEDK